MRAANMDEIEIMGAVFVRISGADVSGKIYTAPIMAYVSPSTEKFYLSRESLVQLGVIPEKFPMVGAAVNSFLTMNTCAIEGYNAPCSCPVRSLPPKRPEKLPFTASLENCEKMKAWLEDYYKSSTWNRCTHQVLQQGSPGQI